MGKVEISQDISTFLNFLDFSPTRLISINLENLDLNPDQSRRSGLPDPNNHDASGRLKNPDLDFGSRSGGLPHLSRP